MTKAMLADSSTIKGCDIDDATAMRVWKDTKRLKKVCENIEKVSEEDAERNRLGFQYGDKFVYY